jgi:hypothetical protein
MDQSSRAVEELVRHARDIRTLIREMQDGGDQEATHRDLPRLHDRKRPPALPEGEAS